ncbi:MAG: TetR family transcriptional regulator C-terminal domain-containing protein [Verrucomicrobiota bacterium]
MPKGWSQKGEFLPFLRLKGELAVTALDAEFKNKSAEMDSLFSPTVPPLDRIRNYCEFAYRKQVEMKKQCGCVLGCPLFTLGSEVSTQEQKLRSKIQEILEYHGKYFESAIRDAHSTGLIDAPDIPAKARMIRAYFEGLLTQARIQNDAEVLREMANGIFAMLGVKESIPA